MKKKRISIVLIIFVLIITTIFLIFPENKVKNSEEIIETVSNMAEELGYENALSELSVLSTEQVGDNVYYRLQQNYNGIPVYGRSVVYVTGKNGKTVSVTGNVADINTMLAPTVTQEKLEEKIEDYVRNDLDHSLAESINVPELNEENLCIYDLGKDGKQELAYSLQVSVNENSFLSSYDMVVDATEGKILSCCSNIYTEMVPFTLDGKSEKDMLVDLNEQKNEDGSIYYSMLDEARNIRIYNANNATLQYEIYDFSNNLVMERNGNFLRPNTKNSDIYFKLLSENGITEPVSEENPPEFDKKAVALLSNLQTTYEFYEDILDIEGIGTSDAPDCINAVYNDYKGGNDTNAYCKTGRQMKDILLSFGTKNSLKLDVVAHEYTHAIERHRNGMLYEGESGAIMEAISDIFGELVESWKKKKAPDWKFDNSRNIANPEKGNRPSVYKGKNWKDTSNPTEDNDWGEVHNNSTVISHVAYLIWDRLDGDNSEKINNLANLWYSAMVMMPADCDFEQCRIFVELAAQNLNFTEEQIGIIQGAFDEAGIYTQEFAYELSEQSTLMLVGKSGELYDNYNLYIMPIKIGWEAKSLISENVDVNYVINNSKDVRAVSTAKPYELKLEKGVYAIAMVDNENTENTIVNTFLVRDEGVDSFTIQTEFGDLVQLSYEKAYESLLEKYLEACSRKDWFENHDLYNSEYSDLNLYILDAYHTPVHYDDIAEGDLPFLLGYSYYDIDGNGIPELLFASYGTEIVCFDIYTFSENDVIRLTPEPESIYTAYGIYTNGVIQQYNKANTYYEFAETGDSLLEVHVEDPNKLLGKGGYDGSCWTVFAEDIPSDVQELSNVRKMTAAEIYDKLAAHYAKGTEDASGDELAVMKGQFDNETKYSTTVRCGVPGNPSASQMLYMIEVDAITGEVTQTFALGGTITDRYVKFYLKESTVIGTQSRNKNIKDLYTKVIDNCKRKIDYENLPEYYKNECYGLIEDLNNDGTEELILNYCEDEERRCEIWTLKGNQAVCIFDILAGYYASEGYGGYLDLMEFQGECYLTFFNRTEELSTQEYSYYLRQEDWIFYKLTDNVYAQKHTLQIQYSYDSVYEVPRAERYMYDGKEISESEFFEMCPEKVADVIGLGGNRMEEGLLNSVSNVHYDATFIDREEGFEILLEQLELKKEISGHEVHEIYGDFLINKNYEKYIYTYWGEPESYAILDIDADGNDELLIKSEYNVLTDDNEFFVFSYEQSSGEIVFWGDKVDSDLQAEYQRLP